MTLNQNWKDLGIYDNIANHNGTTDMRIKGFRGWRTGPWSCPPPNY